MQYRIDQKTGKELSVLGFGCMRFPKNADTVDELIVQAVQQGINYFDTAYIYPGNEEALGRVLEENNIREQVYIATKLPLFLVRSQKDFDKFFDKELERLKTNYIDYYLMHMIATLSQWQALCEMGIEKWISDKKASGTIRQIGFSFHGPKDEFMAILDAYNWEFCQIQYNYSDENYQAGVAGLKKAASKDIPVIIMEPLLGGKLAAGLPKEAEVLLQNANSDYSPAEWALRWLWNQPEITVVLSGMNEMSQLKENINAANRMEIGALTDVEKETLEKVREIFKTSNKIPCTGCGYCQPCPHHVNIPGCFSAYNNSFILGRFTGFQQYMQSTGALGKEECRASLCVQCGLCEKHCPQEIKISEELKIVKRKMETWWYRFGIGAFRFFLGRNK